MIASTVFIGALRRRGVISLRCRFPRDTFSSTGSRLKKRHDSDSRIATGIINEFPRFTFYDLSTEKKGKKETGKAKKGNQCIEITLIMNNIRII